MTDRRIPPITPEHWTGETIDTIFDISVPPGSPRTGSDFNAILMMAQHPELTVPWLHFNNVASAGVSITLRIKEIAILRVAWRYGCDYEWIQHVLSGTRVGLTNAHFEALKGDPADPIWTDEERAVVRFADDQCDRREVSDVVWAEVSVHFDKKQAMELLYVMGAYQLLAFMFNSAQVQIEPAYLQMALDMGAPMVSDRLPQAAEPPRKA